MESIILDRPAKPFIKTCSAPRFPVFGYMSGGKRKCHLSSALSAAISYARDFSSVPRILPHDHHDNLFHCTRLSARHDSAVFVECSD